MPDVFEGNTIPDPSDKPEVDGPTAEQVGDADGGSAEGGSADGRPAGGGPVHVETAYARGVGSSADIDGTHHDAAAPGEGEGTGIGSSGDSGGTPD